ncbi:unnamed protein product, partial [Laminaria digitata]
PRRPELKSPQEDKMEARKSSRKRAQQYAQSLSASDHGEAGSAEPPNSIAGGTSDSDDHNPSDTNSNNVSDGVDSSDVDMAGGMEPPPSRKSRLTTNVPPPGRVTNHVPPPGRVTNHVPPPGRVTNRVAPPRRVTNHVAPPPREQSTPLETPPPMPQIFPGRLQSVPSLPPFLGIPDQTPPKSAPSKAGRLSTGLVTDPSPRSSFLRYAGEDEGAGGVADATLASASVGSRTPALPGGGAKEPAVAQSEGRPGRHSFLRRVSAKGGGGTAVAKEAAAPAVV